MCGLQIESLTMMVLIQLELTYKHTPHVFFCSGHVLLAKSLKMHENLGFLVQKLHYFSLDDLVKKISCQTENIKCMYGECSECKDLSCPVSRVQPRK